jgi:hypothetical protein
MPYVKHSVVPLEKTKHLVLYGERIVVYCEKHPEKTRVGKIQSL